MERREKTPRSREFRVFGIKVKGYRILAVVITVAMCLLTIVSVALIVKRFLTVQKFDIVGVSIYDEMELASVAGIKRGMPLYSLDCDALEKKLLEECPYLDTVEVEQRFPNKVRFRVEGRNAQWYLDISGVKYALDANLLVMTETDEVEGVTHLILPSVKSAMYGEVPSFGNSETEVKKTLEVISALRQTPFKTRITEVDLESRWDVWLTVDGCYRVSMGDVSDFEAKLRAVESILDEEEIKNYTEGTITIVKGVGGYTGAFSHEKTRG